MRQIRIDFVIAFLAAFGIGAFVNFGAGKIIDVLEEKSKEIVYSDTEIGAAAGEGTPVVSSIAGMMEEDYFTFYIDDDWSIMDMVYFEGTTYHIYTMESGETVLVDDYYYNSDYGRNKEDASMFSSGSRYKILPVGRVVKGELPEGLKKKLEEEDYVLSDTSFYVDMRGKFKDFSRKDYENTARSISFFIGFIVFFLVRYMSIASGLFPPIVPLRFLPTWKKYVEYYGVIYYGDSIRKINSLRMEGRMAEAAYEFCRLAEIDEEEAAEAMGYWNEICGEGILHVKKDVWES